MTRFAAAFTQILVAGGLAAPAVAQGSDPFPLTGTYEFRTDQQANGQPVCTESWSFANDGTMTVLSGNEVVTKRYRFEHNRDGDWLVTTNISTNFQPDCSGTVAKVLSSDERRSYLVAFNDDVILTCAAPGHMPDGSPFVSSCFGKLIPVQSGHDDSAAGTK